MIFDDHDDPRRLEHLARLARGDGAPGLVARRISAGLASYWVYQHLGNLDPDTLADRRALPGGPRGRRRLAAARDFAARADAAVGAEGIRWSYRWDLGRTRLLIIDSRCGRVLNPGAA